MIILNLRIENFKNYEQAAIRFEERIHCLTGPNGAGKTNILDAIFYLCTGKSYFNPADAQLIGRYADWFSLSGQFSLNGKEESILCVQMKGRRKVIKRNDEAYTRLVDHYGVFPVVMVAPGDLELVTGGSEERRKWMDSVISWTDHEYLNLLLQYDKIMRQRNAVLRDYEPGQSVSAARLIKVYDDMLIPVGHKIHEARKAFINAFMPFFKEHHATLSQDNEKVSLNYSSEMLREPLDMLLMKTLEKDLLLQRTGAGPHRDDLEFVLEENPLKRYGSQGQQKTFLLALKLAQHRYLFKKMGQMPLLLLDDVCERLDEQRLRVLFRLIKEKEHFGQVFVTDTSAERIEYYAGNEPGILMFKVENGKIN